MLELYLLTFNCARTLVDPQSLAPVFFNALPKEGHVPDLVAVSLQEIAPIAFSFLGGSYLKPYFDRITTTVQLAADLHSNGNEHLEHVATRSLGMTGLMIFAKPQFAQRIKWIQAAGAGVGFSDMGNKGAVAMRVGIARPGAASTLNLTFAAAHLAPMESNVNARNKDWENLVRNLVFVNDDDSAYSASEERPLLASSTELPTDHDGLFSNADHVFFFGDLNYRTSDAPPGPNDHKSYPQPTASETSANHYLSLLKQDQLIREKEANRTLHGLHELPIDFPPTYKYATPKVSHTNAPQQSISNDENTWVWSKHRYPSWCDRILFTKDQSRSELEPHVYTALPVQPTSDHRPVALSLRINDLSSSLTEGDVSQPPFPVNGKWKSRRDAARRCEIVVGVLSYLTLTSKGNTILVALFGAVLGSLWLASWLRS